MTRPKKVQPTAVQEELLSVVLELIPFVVFWKDRKSRYLGCNAAYAHLAGLSAPEELIGLNDYDLPWSKEESDAYRADDRLVIESNRAKLHIVEKQTATDGSISWIDTSKVPLHSRDGDVIGLLGIYADITLQRENEEQLKQTRKYLEDAISALDSGLVLYDESERLVFCNDRYRDMYGLTKDMAPPGASYAEILAAFTEAHPSIEEPEKWIQDRLDRHRTLDSEWLQVIGDPTIRVSDNLTDSGGIVSLRTDITAYKAIENELRSAKEAAEAASASKSAFLANMSHEIRTPMSAILGFTDLLIEDAVDPSSLDALHTIKRNGESLLGLINDILDLSKVESGNLEAVHEPCSPLEIVNNVAGLLGVRAEQKGVQLIVEPQGSIPSSVHSDPARIQQILMNLVGNALKFTSEGTVSVHVAWTGGEDEGGLRFEITDTGIGMSEEQLNVVFRPFEQADSSTTRIFGGTGLGLTISRRLAELLGGQIEVRSKPGVGSTFILDLPIEGQVWLGVDASPDAKIDPRAGAETSNASSPTRPVAGQLEGVHVLLAEDGRDNQRLITRVLTRAGATVEVCEDGVEAIETLEDRYQEFDVVLMDIQMPRLDGYGATRKLRLLGFTAPIIALTAHAMQGDRELCMDAGCSDYLTKPVNFAELVDQCALHGRPGESRRAG
jgi:PAS domain S-box-containing protein